MLGFQDIIGHEDVVRHLQTAIEAGKVSHSYLLSGARGSGKKTLANTFAAALQCRGQGQKPCMECESCKKAAGRNHPDILTVVHEKPAVISVDEAREQLVNDVQIRPYQGPYKVYIVPDADLMNVQAQNAILKTIEEPPEYAVFLLLTTNADSLLPTIRSRCVRLDLKVIGDDLIRNYLMEHLHVSDYEAEIDVSLAQGSIGRAREAAVSQEFSEISLNAQRILKNVDRMEVYELTEAIGQLTADKNKIDDYLDIFQFWFRDVLLFKATQEIDKLVFKQEVNHIREQAMSRSYENLEKILDSIEKTRVRLKANVNPELALELLFLTIREK